MTARFRLKHALAHINKHGWTKSAFRADETAAACLIGAMLLEKEDPRYLTTTAAWHMPGVTEAVKACKFTNMFAAFRWNDARRRKKIDVITRLETALASLPARKPAHAKSR